MENEKKMASATSWARKRRGNGPVKLISATESGAAGQYGPALHRRANVARDRHKSLKRSGKNQTYMPSEARGSATLLPNFWFRRAGPVPGVPGAKTEAKAAGHLREREAITIPTRSARGVLMKIQVPSIAVSLAIGAVFAISAVGVSGTAKAQQQPPTNGWYKVCAKQEDNDICNVQFQSVANTGQLVTAISLLEIKGKINRKSLQVTVPTGRLITPGIKVKVDDKKELTLPYFICVPQSCIAEIPLDDSIIALFKGGSGLTATSTNFQNKPNPVQITLDGFTAAFDGPPLKRDELQARQQQLQEELRKKAEEQRKKLQEEQDKAKKATDN
jgi:invasion protein IalB